MSRFIDLTDYPMAHPPVLNWLRANGLNPKHLPRDQVMEAGDGLLRVTEFVFTPDGYKKISGDGVVTESFVTTLISPPETHGL